MSAFNVGDLGSIPGSGRSPEEGNGNPLRYSCLENPMDGGAWWVTVRGVTKSQTLLSYFTFTASITVWLIILGQKQPLAPRSFWDPSTLPKEGGCVDLIGQRWDSVWATLTSGQGQCLGGDDTGPALSFHSSSRPTCSQEAVSSADPVRVKLGQDGAGGLVQAFLWIPGWI